MNWELISFAYFLIKSLVISVFLKKIKVKNLRLGGLAVGLISFTGTLVLPKVYEKEISLGFFKGIMGLPSYSMTYLAADIISSGMLMLIWIRIFSSRSIAKEILVKGKYFLIFIEFARVFLLVGMFEIYISNQVINKNMESGDVYNCIKWTLVVDIKKYYLREKKVPATLEDFTDLRIYPPTGKKLVYEYNAQLNKVNITDEQGNKVVNGKDNLEEFLPLSDGKVLEESAKNAYCGTNK